MVVLYSQRGDLAQVPLHEGSCTGLLAQLFIVGGGTQHGRLDRNLGRVCARLTYHSMDISWGSSTGNFYVHRVDCIWYAVCELASKRRGAPRGVRMLAYFLCSSLFFAEELVLTFISSYRAPERMSFLF